MRTLLAISSAVLLTGCSAFQSPGVRVTVLVLVPAAIIALVLWRLRGRRGERVSGRGPRYPDFEDKD